MTYDQESSSIFGSRALPFNARDVVAIGFRRQRLIAFTFLGILVAVVLIGLSLPKRYEASMKILVKRERAEPMVTAEQTPSFQASQAVTEQEINSEIELLWSRDLHQKGGGGQQASRAPARVVLDDAQEPSPGLIGRHLRRPEDCDRRHRVREWLANRTGQEIEPHPGSRTTRQTLI